MGLWFPASGIPRPRPPKPKRGYLSYALTYSLVILRESVVILSGLGVLLVMPWP